MTPGFLKKIPAPADPAAGPVPPVLTPLPLCNIRPDGWLREQIRLSADGYFSHMDDVSFFMREHNGWLDWNMTEEEAAAELEESKIRYSCKNPYGAEGYIYAATAWEEQAYWLRGANKLAALTKNERLTALCDRYFDAILASRRDDGYFGPESLRHVKIKNGEAPDLWPHFVIAEALSDRYDVTGDEAIIDLLHAFFVYCADLPEGELIPERDQAEHWMTVIQSERCCDAVPVVTRIYRMTGDEKLAALCRRLDRIGKEQYDPGSDRHVVNFAERFRYRAQNYPFTRDREDIEFSRRMYEDHMALWGQMPGGLYAADECTREGKTDPRQATETCAMGEIVRSFNVMASLTGESVWADRAERIMFNSYPASHTPDYSALHYLTADNQPEADDRDRDYHNGGMMTRYTAFGYRCCQHNAGMSWPNFVQSMFAKTEDGLALLSYGPASAKALIGENRVEIGEETGYPFDLSVKLTVKCGSPVTLYLRVPSWCEGGSLDSAKGSFPIVPGGGFIRLTAEDGDVLTLRFEASVRYERYPLNNDSVSVAQGPLDFSLRYREIWTDADTHTDRSGKVWTDKDVRAEDPIFPALDLSSPVTVTRSPVTSSPFSPEAAPVVLTARGRRAAEWGIGDDNTVLPVPPSPPALCGDELTLELVPLGCMHARLSVFPHYRSKNNISEDK